MGITPCSGDGFGKVLVVDDDPADVELVTDILSGLGCQIIPAPGGAEGIEIALREKPDLIVLDLHMPEVSGWDVLEALRDQGGDWHPPIMIFTGVSLSPEERQSLAGRVQAVVLKGGGKAELLKEIGRLTKMAFNGS
ncbi:MAG: response regulator [Desulfarculaceae bacterium]|nr:response regulator [Desulfarculaceae bacterium]MCF8071150.1 response regulator [Desulfarculaceae bacterium]MCF8101247.1 response regulator [Desulfarculaceae bacterium]MCF8115204.1 response regulator [Desulfarculaceae bacterium]